MADRSELQAQPKWKKILKTACLILTWTCLGVCGEISGPTLKDLKLLVNTNYEDVSRAISGRSAGFFFGAAIGGILVDKLPRYYNSMVAIGLCGVGGATIIAPHSGSVPLLWFVFTVQGLFEGVVNIVGPKIVMETWLKKASSPIHALHLGFGIGSCIVPEISNPFLAVFKSVASPANFTNEHVAFSNTIIPLTTLSTTNATEEVEIRISRIQWPYLIVGVFTISVSVIFIFYQCCGARQHQISIVEDANKIKTNATPKYLKKQTTSSKDNDSSKEISLCRRIKSLLKLLDPGRCTGGRRFFGVQLFILLFLHLFTAFGGERVYGKFIRSYAIDQMHFSGDDATLLNTTFWISLTVGRFAGFVAARWIPIRILILIEATGGLITALILKFFLNDNHVMLWVLTQFMAFFIAPMIPSGIAWGDFHMELTGLALTFLLCGGSLGALSYMWIIGYIYDNYGYQTFVYLNLAYAIFSVTNLCIMHFSTWGNKGRFEKKEIKENQTKEKSENGEDKISVNYSIS